MTRVQKLELRQSELRQELGALLDTEVDKRGDDYDAKLQKAKDELRALEPDVQAALLLDAEPETRAIDGDAEGREYRAMIDRADLSRFFDATVQGRALDGVESELQQKAGIGGGHSIPLDLISDAPVEHRAAATVAGTVGTTQAPIVQPVFPRSIAAFLGIPQPRVPVGDRSYPVITTGATVHAPAKGAVAAETTGAFTIETLSPGSLQASFRWAREDAARFEGLESALRMNLQDALGSELDKKVLAQTAGGLLGGGLTEPGVPSAVATFDGYIAALTGEVDGSGYAESEADVRMLFGSDTYIHASALRQAASGRSATEYLKEMSGGLRVSSHVPAAAGTTQGAIAAKAINLTHAVSPIWGVDLVRDEVTSVGKREITLTAVMLYAFKVLRTDGFTRLRFKLS